MSDIIPGCRERTNFIWQHIVSQHWTQTLIHVLDESQHELCVCDQLLMLIGPGFSSTSFESLNSNGT